VRGKYSTQVSLCLQKVAVRLAETVRHTSVVHQEADLNATPSTMPRATPNNQPIPLLHDPPPPSAASSSRSSLYSAYSYYQLDSPSGSPPSDSLQVPSSPHTPPPRTPSPLATTSAHKNDLRQPDLADQLLQEGIQHHEANRLREAAIAFERSAKTLNRRLALPLPFAQLLLSIQTSPASLPTVPAPSARPPDRLYRSGPTTPPSFAPTRLMSR